jgi:hypothetical protein
MVDCAFYKIKSCFSENVWTVTFISGFVFCNRNEKWMTLDLKMPMEIATRLLVETWLGDGSSGIVYKVQDKV